MGTAVPRHFISQDAAARFAAGLIGDSRLAALVPALYRRSGVERRHSVLLESTTIDELPESTFYPPASSDRSLIPSTATRMNRYEREAPALAELACQSALSQADVLPQRITHLVTVSCSGFSAPGVDLALVKRLGLSSSVSRTHLGFMGCHGAMNGLRVAQGYAAADQRACVLVCAVELCSLHHQYTSDPQQIVANALFSDGAAAAVIRQLPNTCDDDRDLASVVESQLPPLERRGWRIASQASMILPETEEMMSWRIGDSGFEMTLSPSVPDIISEQLKPWLTTWLDGQKLSIGDVNAWAIHPGGPRVLTACAKAAGFDPSALSPSQSILADYGNMSSPTVLFILERIAALGMRPPCVMLAFGPGLTIEATLLR